MRRKAKFITALLIATTVVVAGGYAMLQVVESEYRNHSMMIAVSRLLRTHVEREHQFPHSWQELSNTPNESDGEFGSFTVQQLSDAVIIDWQSGTDILNGTSASRVNSEFSVITLRNGVSGRWHGDDPNLALIEFLERHRSRTNTSK